MLFLKRIATSAILFVILFLVLLFGTVTFAGGIVGARNISEQGPAKDFSSGYDRGREVGAAFGRRYGHIFVLGSLGVSVIASIALPVSGAFPWCRKPQAPN